MKVIKTVAGMRRVLTECRTQGKTIGLVPTMGFFHEGHLSLMRKACKECDFVVVSLFVNPTQFAPNEDLEKYPRDFKRDQDLAADVGVDAIFYPSVEQMYPEGFSTYVLEEQLSQYLCGVARPSHFRGVTTVVLKLFNIIDPDRAYFGQKDAQQAAIIKRMVRDLNCRVKIRVLPIVREKDGLAMSSRNAYLSIEERQQALILRKSLLHAKNMIDSEQNSCYKILLKMRKMIEAQPAAKIDYLEIVDANTLEKLKKAEGKLLIAVAVYFGKARLIDNIIVNAE